MLFADPSAAVASQADVLNPIALGAGKSACGFSCLVLIHLAGDRGAAEPNFKSDLNPSN